MRITSAFARLRRASELARLVVVLVPLACQGEPAAPLPAPAPTPAPIDARAVAMGEVRGFLARPAPDLASGERLLLQAGPALDDAGRAEARARASSGAIVLLVASDVDRAAAVAYLSGLPGEGAVRAACLPSADRCVPTEP